MKRQRSTRPVRPVRLFPILSGLVFVVVAVLYLLQASGALTVGWKLLLPLELIGLGLAGLLTALYSRAPRREASQESRER
ncbi:putative membrane protein [Streptacidiphilus sp. MAP12-20]|uniref:hypothetical protein n=1 Tax=Streptacidiphilus sp. MAP12-20 TaxID=3156299 RepID=UPI003518F51A